MTFPGKNMLVTTEFGHSAPKNPIKVQEANFFLDQRVSSPLAAGPTKKQMVYFYMPPSVAEGGTSGEAIVGFARPERTSIKFLVTPYPSGLVSSARTVVIPAGQTTAKFRFSVKNDQVENLDRDATITLAVPGAGFEISNTSVIFDDEPLPHVVAISSPGEAVETPKSFYAHVVKITLDKPAADDGFLSISANPADDVQLDAKAFFRKGRKTGYFSFDAFDDDRIDGKVKVTFTVSAAGKPLAKCVGYTIDNESRQINLSLPAEVSEGGKASGILQIGGILPKPLKVALSRSDNTQINMPAEVKIPAGETSAVFDFSALENTKFDGKRKISVNADAPDLLGAARSIEVLDNEVAGFRFSRIDDVSDQIHPLRVTVSAVDIGGITIAGFNGPVGLAVTLANGETLPLSPASVQLSSGVWSGLVTFPVSSKLITGLTAKGAKDLKGETNDFNSMRLLKLTAAELVWDSVRNVIYASVPATASGPYANQVVAIDPLTLQIKAGVNLNQNPGHMVMTGGGEYLYVVLNDGGSIAKIDLDDMSLSSSFELGMSPFSTPLRAADICAVSGQPEVLIVTWKNVYGLAAYENGVARPLAMDDTFSESIEPSADPNVFFGYDSGTTGGKFWRFQLGPDGLTTLGSQPDVVGTSVKEIRASGNQVYSSGGTVVDGSQMKRLGTFGTQGPVYPDLQAGRIFYLEKDEDYFENYQFISAYDPVTFKLIRRITLPEPISSVTDFIRWGANGLAISSGGKVMLFNSPQFVPSEAPADLMATLQATPNPAIVGRPVIYTATVTNAGPNDARNAVVAATLSAGQTIESVSISSGQSSVNGSNVNFDIGDLPVGAVVTLSIRAKPKLTDDVSCSVVASSNSVDPDFGNNVSGKRINFDFKTGPGVVNHLNLSANSLVRDPVRNLLWAAIPASAGNTLASSVVSINPVTGWVSDPIALYAEPLAGSIAISPNGGYLYVGLSDVAEISRIDLESQEHAILRIPLGLNSWGQAGIAEDIEALEGDGTSIIVTTTGDASALVIDGTMRRPVRTGFYTVNRIERTSTAGVFVGFNSKSSGWELTHLSVTDMGVSITKSVQGVVNLFNTDIQAEGNLLVSTNGEFADLETLTLRKNLGYKGIPCVDAANNRIYLLGSRANGATIWSFNAMDGKPVGRLDSALLGTSLSNAARELLRWGTDGFAILGADGSVQILRSEFVIPPIPAAPQLSARSASIPPPASNDADNDGIPDVLEHLFATSPSQFTANPVRLAAVQADGRGRGQISFPRRAGVSRPSYGYEISGDLTSWKPIADVSETVVSTRTVDGVTIEEVSATFAVPRSEAVFLRLCWFNLDLQHP